MSYILLVDDDFDSSEALAHFLEKAGHRVKHVPDGREALAAVINKLPDVLVLDWKMPKMDGLSLLQVLRGYLRLSHLPVVLFTAHPDLAGEQKLAEYDVHRMLLKGEHGPLDVLRSVESIVYAVQSGRPIQSALSQGEQTPDVVNVRDARGSS